ncbi:uncharacterized protein E0L32_012204 [Thyridium curvatum]|uniref:Uncharacterized protein n=1 Tax=Thyridium curvatum TaxID=1093900 RepID=A0A507BBP3_9PEZI|nr:uncharacterized protein E0L32_012204 [Thyridium curvatum]TPX17317.1 hypothetical protein E0L32_012204 [Thyridium curvatum]
MLLLLAQTRGRENPWESYRQAPGSLNSVIRQNPRTRLYPPPHLWTARHVELLGATFVDVDINHTDDNDRDDSQPHLDLPHNVAEVGKLRAYGGNPTNASRFLKSILKNWGFCLDAKDKTTLPFRFGRHICCHLPIQTLCHSFHPPPTTPTVAMVNLYQVTSSRNLRVVDAKAGGRCETIQYLALPCPPAKREPCVLAVLLALAAHLYPSYNAEGLAYPPSVQVHLIDTSPDHPSRGIYLSSADITPQSVASFQHPDDVFLPTPKPLKVRRAWLDLEG